MSPITLALAGLLAYQTYRGQGRLAELLGRAGVAGMPGGPGGPATAPSGNILGDLGRILGGSGAGGAGSTITAGLNDLLRRFQDAGRGDAAQSWVSTGQNEPVAPSDLEQALGEERITWLMQRTGLSREELLQGLSRELPEAVDKLTPNGRVPDEREADRLVSQQGKP